MKRSRTAVLLAMGASPLLLAACHNEPDATRSGLYTSVEACTAATHDANTCADAYLKANKEAEAEAPRYASAETCEADFGQFQCIQRGTGSHSYFGPLMTGFMLSQLMHHGRAASGFDSAPAFRDRWDHWRRPAADPRRDDNGAGGYSGSYGGGYASSYGGIYRSGSGRAMTAISSTPDHAVTVSRAVTASRGGFGRSGSSRGFGGFHGFGG
jgi:uncharacterized protein YgiB involved in biofilm formation